MSGSTSDHRPIAFLLTPVLPLPCDSGRALRAWDWMNELARTHRVCVLVANEHGFTPPSKDYPAASVFHFKVTPSSGTRFARAFGMLVFPWCLLSRRGVADWQHVTPELESVMSLARLFGEKVDRIIVFRFYLHDLAQAVSKQWPQAEMEIDMDDIESKTRWSVAASLMRMGRKLEALSCMGSGAQYAMMERFLTGHYTKAWLANGLDGLCWRTRLASSIAERPNRISVPSASELHYPRQTCTLRLMFIGTLDYPPNEEAVLDLVKLHLPELAKRLDRPWSLCVVGRHASDRLVAILNQAPQIEFIPDADCLTDYYQAAQVIVVPLRAGGGTKLKTLEAFAHMRPVVSTAHGVRGLKVTSGEHYLAAETPAEFADAIVRLASDARLAERIALAGHALCRQRYEIP
jgi:glycosyltransferase involved in cell wall biosynthesis